MVETDIASAVISDIKSQFASGTDNYYSVAPESIDGASDQDETKWSDENWTQRLAYYKKIPELRRVINALAVWTVGKGFKADDNTTLALNKIRGWGFDTFNGIMMDTIRVSEAGGNFYAEIIRDDDGDLLNVKKLDPEHIVHVVDKFGMLIRFEQKVGKNKKNRIIKLDEMFYYSRDRFANEIHGTSLIEALEETILSINEALADWRRVLHRNVDPVMIYYLDTDDPTEIAAFKLKADKAKGKGENIYIPKGAVQIDQLSLAPNAVLNPETHIANLKERFYEESGVPKIVVGGAGGFTEAAVKIAYLAFQQTIEAKQLELEEQVGRQLGVTIELEFPASLENELLSDKAKDETNGASQPNETTAGRGK